MRLEIQFTHTAERCCLWSLTLSSPKKVIMYTLPSVIPNIHTTCQLVLGKLNVVYTCVLWSVLHPHFISSSAVCQRRTQRPRLQHPSTTTGTTHTHTCLHTDIYRNTSQHTRLSKVKNSAYIFSICSPWEKPPPQHCWCHARQMISLHSTTACFLNNFELAMFIKCLESHLNRCVTFVHQHDRFAIMSLRR